jgi:hypothetical protein
MGYIFTTVNVHILATKTLSNNTTTRHEGTREGQHGQFLLRIGA